MISDSLMEVIEVGTVTGLRRKALYPVNYTNDPFVIAQNERMVAINSAIEGDLTSQACSDSIGMYIYSGFGGQVDFIRGATRADVHYLVSMGTELQSKNLK